MTSLSAHLENYLAVRRSLGYDLSFQERVLRRFTASPTLRALIMSRSICSCDGKSTSVRRTTTPGLARLGMVRAFAAWLQGIDPRNEVPPAGLISGKLRPAAALHLHRRTNRRNRCRSG